jgi:hypothetical protein
MTLPQGNATPALPAAVARAAGGWSEPGVSDSITSRVEVILLNSSDLLVVGQERVNLAHASRQSRITAGVPAA